MVRPGGLSSEPPESVGNLVVGKEDTFFAAEGEPGRSVSRTTVRCCQLLLLLQDNTVLLDFVSQAHSRWGQSACRSLLLLTRVKQSCSVQQSLCSSALACCCLLRKHDAACRLPQATSVRCVALWHKLLQHAQASVCIHTGGAGMCPGAAARQGQEQGGRDRGKPKRSEQVAIAMVRCSVTVAGFRKVRRVCDHE